MAYVPSFEHDIFISYAHEDNLDGRVTAFHGDLVKGLRSLLSDRAYSNPQDWIFFDERSLGYGDLITPKLEYSASRSAVMIALVSPSYLGSEYCRLEWNWFLASRDLARDPLERRLIPVMLVNTPDADLQREPRLLQDPLRAPADAMASTLVPAIAGHLRKARQEHGAVFIAPAYQAAKPFRQQLIGELRGFRCDGGLWDEAALKRTLAESKLAVHFLGDAAEEHGDSLDWLEWSLQHCPGKTLGLLPPGAELTRDDREFLAGSGNHPNWSQPQGTVTELAQHISEQLQAFRMPDPAIPIGLACDNADLSTACGFARAIYEQSGQQYRVEVPQFAGGKGTASAWRKFRTRRQGLVLYWRQGDKRELDNTVASAPLGKTLGRAWYVSTAGDVNAEHKVTFEPPPPFEKILDEHQPFQYEKIQPFLEKVRREANK